ncbi:hypothetical protein ZWY2020_044603 [Hordeum vulgare]|nr:hypothetical protein ZWY2020_044603 [Hordeum vulgare]
MEKQKKKNRWPSNGRNKPSQSTPWCSQTSSPCLCLALLAPARLRRGRRSAVRTRRPAPPRPPSAPIVRSPQDPHPNLRQNGLKSFCFVHRCRSPFEQ